MVRYEQGQNTNLELLQGQNQKWGNRLLEAIKGQRECQEVMQTTHQRGKSAGRMSDRGSKGQSQGHTERKSGRQCQRADRKSGGHRGTDRGVNGQSECWLKGQTAEGR